MLAFMTKTGYNPEFDSLKTETAREALWHKVFWAVCFCCMIGLFQRFFQNFIQFLGMEMLVVK